MRALLAGVPVMVWAAASCGTSAMTTSPPDTGDAGTSADPTSGHVPTCVPSCTTASDCGTPGDPLYDPSHFTCTAGVCAWQGCASASACGQEAHGGSFVCQASGGSPVPACVPACQKPADCVPQGNADVLENAAHFACTGGACVYLGCTSTAECATGLGTSKVTCVQPAGATTKTCVPTCTTASDCASSQGGVLTNAGHYACKGGTCAWLGCKSASECTQVLQSTDYICQ